MYMCLPATAGTAGPGAFSPLTMACSCADLFVTLIAALIAAEHHKNLLACVNHHAYEVQLECSALNMVICSCVPAATGQW